MKTEIYKLKKRIKEAEQDRLQIRLTSKQLEQDYKRGKLSYEDYFFKLSKYLKGKSEREWYSYYNGYIKECEKQIQIYKTRKEVSREWNLNNKHIYSLLILLAFALIPLYYSGLFNGVTGYATVETLNETTTSTTLFEIARESLTGSNMNLTIWDDSDTLTVYANYSVFYANFSNLTGGPLFGNDGSNFAFCEFKHNKTGFWSSPINMTYYTADGLYKIIADGKYTLNSTSYMPTGNYSYNVTCTNNSFSTIITATDNLTTSVYSTGLAVINSTNIAVNNPVTFTANYTKNNGYGIPGLGSEIGLVVWNSSDSDANDGTYAIAFADLNNDGKENEIVLGTNGNLRAFYPNGTAWWTATEPAYDGSEIEVFDADNDTFLNEVVLIGTSSEGLAEIRIFNETGNQLWSHVGFGTDFGAPSTVAIGDFDNDNIRDDIAFGTWAAGTRGFFIYTTSNGITWTQLWNATVSSANIFDIATGDINGDGLIDLVGVARETGGRASLFVFSGNNGTQIWNASFDFLDSVAVVDLDHDGKKDEIVVGEFSNIRYFNETGSNIFTATAPIEDVYEIHVSDLDNDGYEDDVVGGDGTGSSTGPIVIRALDNSSNSLWTTTLGSNTSVYYVYSMIIGDIDSNGEKDIVAGSPDGIVYVLNRTGGVLWSYSIGLGTISGAAVASRQYGRSPATDISDINNDGINDIAVASAQGYAHIFQDVKCEMRFNDTVLVYNMTWNQSIKLWQYNRTFSNQGDYSWNATCIKNGYTTQVVNDIAHILDTTPPATVTSLTNISSNEESIYWNWTNPSSDFNHSVVHLNKTFKVNTSDAFYNATELLSDAEYVLTVHTSDPFGNVNTTDVNSTGRTASTTTTTTTTSTTTTTLKDVPSSTGAGGVGFGGGASSSQKTAIIKETTAVEEEKRASIFTYFPSLPLLSKKEEKKEERKTEEENISARQETSVVGALLFDIQSNKARYGYGAIAILVLILIIGAYKAIQRKR